MSSNSYLKPDITFSDEDDDRSLSARKISNKIKKTQTNQDAIKHPNTFYVDDDQEPEDDSDVIISDDDEEVDSPPKRQFSNRKRKSFKKGSDRSSSKKQKKIDSSDEEFLPDDDDSEDNDDIESIASEDLSDENISDSDYDPDREDDECDETDRHYFGSQNDTINLSSDGESPSQPQPSRVIQSNSREFWSKVEELKNKGFSIQQAGGVNATSKSNCT